MKALKLTSLALAMALAGGYANATTYTAPGTLGVGQTYTFENGLVALGATGFADTFKFTLGSGVTGANFLFNIALPSWEIASFAVNYTSGSIAVTGDSFYTTGTYWDGEDYVTFSILNKAEYTFKLTGLSSGEKTIDVSGSFASAFPVAKNYSLTVSAVPEPESYALFLAGLGLMAGIARRKSKSN